MSTSWNADLYLRFQKERTQPAIDLAARIELQSPRRIVDIGCGPGTSTRVLWERWPEADVIGLDNSPDMIARARSDYPDRPWQPGDPYDLDARQAFDLVYSNAAIQWIPHHERLIPHLHGLVAPGGALAVQIPLYDGMPVRRCISDVASSERWRERMAGVVTQMTFHTVDFYYDILSSCAERLSMWETTYIHEMQSHESIVEMIRGTGMRPYLDRLHTHDETRDFLAGVLASVRDAYPAQRNGRVLFPFRRLFFVAYRQ
jgi:trans-aconitate 2-methyltransferase